jgi:hypothetical protein
MLLWERHSFRVTARRPVSNLHEYRLENAG